MKSGPELHFNRYLFIHCVTIALRIPLKVINCRCIGDALSLGMTPLINQKNDNRQKTMRKLSVFIATSLDGYIAKPNDDLSFLKAVEKDGEDYGYAAFTATIDTIIIGRKTYDYVLKEVGSSHYDNGQRDVYVITRTEKPGTGRTIFYTGNLTELVQQLKSESGKHIYCDGGAEIINELLKGDLIDEFIISVVPVLIGEGTRLFKDGRPEQQLDLISTKTFDTGLTQLHYRRKRYE